MQQAALDARSSRRGRGGRGRGRGGRGGRGGTSARSRGGRGGRSGDGERGALRGSRRGRQADDLGTNADRFSKRTEERSDEEEGVDFEVAAAEGMGDGRVKAKEIAANSDALRELCSDFSALESVLASGPLWVRLGEEFRDALGVPAKDTMARFLEEITSDDADSDVGVAHVPSAASRDLLDEMKQLSVQPAADEEVVPDNNDSMPITNKKGVDSGESAGQIGKAILAQDEEDDFDDWLDDM